MGVLFTFVLLLFLLPYFIMLFIDGIFSYNAMARRVNRIYIYEFGIITYKYMYIPFNIRLTDYNQHHHDNH